VALNQARDVFMAWCLIKQEVPSWRGAYLSKICLHGVVLNQARDVFMAWCLIKQDMPSWRGA
jgi:hypothetical protein